MAKRISEMKTDYVFVDSLLYGDDEGLCGVKDIGNEAPRAGEGGVTGNACHQLECQQTTVSGEKPVG